MQPEPLVMWTVYDHPRDFPDGFIARRWVIDQIEPRPTEEVLTSKTLEGLRQMFRAAGMTSMERSVDDDPAIVEVWL